MFALFFFKYPYQLPFFQQEKLSIIESLSQALWGFGKLLYACCYWPFSVPSRPACRPGGSWTFEHGSETPVNLGDGYLGYTRNVWVLHVLTWEIVLLFFFSFVIFLFSLYLIIHYHPRKGDTFHNDTSGNPFFTMQGKVHGQPIPDASSMGFFHLWLPLGSQKRYIYVGNCG